MSAVLTHPEITPQRLDCLAGHEGLELANVVLRKLLFEMSGELLGFLGHFGTRDFSRSSHESVPRIGALAAASLAAPLVAYVWCSLAPLIIGKLTDIPKMDQRPGF